jgi:hypothetical protein
MHSSRMVLPLLLSIAACGPSQSEYDAIASERASLQGRVSQLEAEMDELRNGAPRRLGQITSAFEAERYDEVVSATRELAQRHPGSPEAIQALRFSSQAEQRVAQRAREAEAQAETRRREAERSERDRVRSTVRVRRLWTSNPNSASGVDLHIVWQNTSSKTVKYASFTVQAYNAVGDPVSCTIRDYSEFSGRITGPVPPGGVRGGDRYWDSAWYNSTIVRARLTRIQIEYTDGSTVEFSEDQARLALN